MTIDGAKLRNFRLRKGMSQEKLGLMSKLNTRTALPLSPSKCVLVHRGSSKPCY
jgi:hypothetical protein